MRRHRLDDRGATLVEFAIILPILLLILFGIIEWSLAFKDSLTVASATRAGARTASASPRSPTFAADTAAAMDRAVTALPKDSIQELWIYRAAADGTPEGGGGGFGSCTVCVKYRWDEPTTSFVQVSDTWSPDTHRACAGEADAVGIYLEVEHEFLTGFFPPTMTLTDHTVMNFEPIPSFQVCRP